MMIVFKFEFQFFMFARLKIVSLMATKCDEIDGKVLSTAIYDTTRKKI